MEAVGIVLNGIMKSEALKPYILPRTVCSHAPTHYGGVLHHAPNFHQSQLIRLIIQTANGIPSPCDILHCSQSTNEENLQSFILRTEYFPHRCYIILNVNALPHDLQEVCGSVHEVAEEFVSLKFFIPFLFLNGTDSTYFSFSQY